MTRGWVGLAALLVATVSLGGAMPTAEPRDGIALLREMRDRYHGNWPQTLTFVQRTALPGGKIETWYEAIQLPGRLRIDIAPLDSMKTLIFRSDSLYEFEGGKLKSSGPQVHPLMVLGFDVYEDPVEKTAEKLGALGFDLSVLRHDTWEGRPAYVVGAAAGDSSTRQFWIDKGRLYFVRMIEPAKRDSTVRLETRFGKYVKAARGWVETEVLFLANGEQRAKEEYGDVRANVPLDSALFDPTRWSPPTWVKATPSR